MGSAEQAEHYITPEEYLAAELVREQRHEYLAGVIYAMAGASVGHSRIVSNIAGELRNQLRGQPCEAFTTDVKVRIRQSTAEFFYYPDVMVDCTHAANTAYYAEQPRVIFEVMSPGTARTDREEKLRNYQSLASLDAYVLVDQSRVAVTLYRRTAEGWERELLTDLETGAIALPSIECELPLAAVYERTGLTS
jgi:Uma2 family endonuclease